MPTIRTSSGCIFLFFGLLSVQSASAGRILEVGQDKPYKLPSEALRAALEGDDIRLDAGEYFDCAIVKTNNLIIEGADGGASVITDKACGGKGLLVVTVENTIVRNLTLTRSRVPDGNGAGIRFEGRDIAIEGVKFVNNQIGLLASDRPEGTIRIVDCDFLDNGSGDARRPLHAVATGQLALLHIERSGFKGTRGFSDIKSDASRTELSQNTVEAASPSTTSYMIEQEGGALLMEGNRFHAMARAVPLIAPVLVTSGNSGARIDLRLTRNTVVNDSGAAMPFLRNWTGDTPSMEGNDLTNIGEPVSSDGRFRHSVGLVFHSVRDRVVAVKDGLRHVAGLILRHLTSH